MSQKSVKPIEVKADGSLEVFEVYSEKLGKTIRIGIHSGDAKLLSDRGLVMIAPPKDP